MKALLNAVQKARVCNVSALEHDATDSVGEFQWVGLRSREVHTGYTA